MVLPSPVGSEARLGLVFTLALVLVCPDATLLLPVVEGVPVSRFFTNTLTLSRSCAPLSSLTLTTKVKVESLLTSGAVNEAILVSALVQVYQWTSGNLSPRIYYFIFNIRVRRMTCVQDNNRTFIHFLIWSSVCTRTMIWSYYWLLFFVWLLCLLLLIFLNWLLLLLHFALCCWAVRSFRVVFSFFPVVVSALTCGTPVTTDIISDATRVMIKNLSNFFTNR